MEAHTPEWAVFWDMFHSLWGKVAVDTPYSHEVKSEWGRLQLVAERLESGLPLDGIPLK